MKLIYLLSVLTCFSSFASDPLSSMQWGIKNIGQPIFRSTGELTRELINGTPGVDIGIPENYKYSDKKIIVAVIDSGVDIYHPDLKDNIWFNPKCKGMTKEEIAAEDCYGWNFLDGNTDLTDDIGHGTHVAGIIAATKGNGIGIEGVASENVQIMPLKILNSKVKSFVYEKRVITDIIADAIAYAVTNGASVINLSLGWPALIHTRKVRYAIDTAIERNIAIVVASGNNNKKLPVYPCSYNEVICVGAMDNTGKISEFSNFGGKVDLLAPGEGIVSTYPRNLESRVLRIPGYETKQGSSQAAPFVSGLVALMKSQNENLTLDQIKLKLFKSSEKRNLSRGVKYGVVNLESALATNSSAGLPLFKLKSLTEVVVKEDGKFEFTLPLRALVKDIPLLEFKVAIKDGDVTIFDKKFSAENISSVENSEILISAEITDFRISSHLDLTITYNDTILVHEIALVREMLNISDRISKKLPFKDSEILTIQNGRSSSALRKVISNKYNSKTLDYFIQKKSSIPEMSAIEISRISIEGSSDLEIEIPEIGKLINIVKNDFDNDGRSDYMIYSLSKDEKNLVLSFIGPDGSPLYGENSQWFLEISTFEGLPFFNGEIKFEFLNIDFWTYGKVKVPVFMKSWLMPEADNTRDPLDRVSLNQSSSRPYYLKPYLADNKVSLEIRTLESLKFLESFRSQFSISARAPLNFDHLFEQDELSKKVEGMIVSGHEFSKRYFYISYTSSIEYSSHEIFFNGLSLESNRTIVSRYDATQFNASYALNFRDELRTVFWNLDGERQIQNFNTGSWGDLIIDIFDFSKSNKGNLTLLESRYFIHAIDSIGNSHKLPINRESSFPGVNFSETFKKVNIKSGLDLQRGILVDSSLIYGDRLYSMVYAEDSFTSPTYSSFLIPKNCKNLDIHEFREGSYIVLACQDKFLRATLELVPLKERIK